jgi:hypothetical protein
MRVPFNVGGKPLTVTASIGIATVGAERILSVRDCASAAKAEKAEKKAWPSSRM